MSKSEGLPLQEDFREVEGLLIRTGDSGGAGRPLLMLNGLGASLEVLAPLREQLADFRTVAFDPPGVGKSTGRPWPLRLAAHADIAARILDQLKIEKVDLFGVSWGGALAQEFAHRHSDRVHKLILCSTTAGPGLLAPPSVYRAFLSAADRSSEHFVSVTAPTLFGGHVRNNPRILYDTGVFQKLARKNSRSYLFQMFAALGWTSLHYLWRLKLETLIITGDDDPLVRPYNSRILKSYLRNSELAVIKGEGHFLVVTSATEVAVLIRNFLRGDPGQALAA